MPIDKIFYLTRIYNCDTGNGKWGDHAIVYILIIQQSFTIRANSNEVQGLSFIPHGKLTEHLQDINEPLEPVLKAVYKQNILDFWWKNLNSLHTIKNHTDILRIHENCNKFLK